VASASGDRARDRIEAAALARACPPGTAVTAIRGAVGDFGAAGALAAAAAVLAIAHDAVPPVVGLAEPAVAGLDVVRGAARATAVRVAVVPGLARGGLCRPLRFEAP
jgi:3-oxoacyl-(acyl-carrier-protein) synthase